MNMRAIKTTALAMILGLGFSTLVSAQPPQGAQPPAAGPGQEMPAMDFSDADLQSFVEVQESLQEVRVKYSTLLEEAADQTEAQALQEQAGQEMVEAVEASGLDVDAYNQIAMALQQDPELQARVQGMME